MLISMRSSEGAVAPFQFGFGHEDDLALWVQLSTMKGPDEMMSAASAQLVWLSGTGVSSHMAAMFEKKLVGVFSVKMTVCSSGASTPIGLEAGHRSPASSKRAGEVLGRICR